jgi:hypothetical protein
MRLTGGGTLVPSVRAESKFFSSEEMQNFLASDEMQNAVRSEGEGTNFVSSEEKNLVSPGEKQEVGTR